MHIAIRSTRAGWWLFILAIVLCAIGFAANAQESDSTDTSPQPVEQTPVTATAPENETPAAPPIIENAEFDFLDTAARIWHATLFTAGDQEIKLNQIIVALLTMLIGLWIAKQVTQFFAKRLLATNRVSETVADTLSKIAYYIGVAVVVLIAMQVAGIPTTIFTVLGGALAIGVGFGAQNLFNNLISGLILLTEKPIRKNDIVEVDGTEGIVAEISNRRTRIRRSDGVDVLVPNSTFLQTNVINWTLFDALIRGRVSIGVAYGTSAKTTRDLLLKAAESHGRVEKKPPPTVLFSEFGDNALIFDLYFWCNVTRPLDRRLIESDLRFEIDHLFAEAKLVIAYPQRDVHLDTNRPLEIKLLEKDQV